MKQNNSIIKKYEAILKAVKSITNAWDCSIFLLDSELSMDEEEKKEVFERKIDDIKRSIDDEHIVYSDFLSQLSSEDTDKYSILTFFEGTKEHWRLKNYKERPAKYIVFNYKEQENNKYIPIQKEGITAYTARTGEAQFFTSRPDVERFPAFSGNNEGDNKIHDNCCQIAIIPLIDKDNIIGVIRCDIYKDIKDFHFSAETLSQLKSYNDILCKIIHLGKEEETDLSYNKLFQGINLLESLKAIEPLIADNDTDRNIYKDTKKLFYVLKRRRYFGEDAIV